MSRKSHCNSLLEDGFNLLHPAVLHNIMISCSLESKIIELQKTDPSVFHIKRKMKDQETKHFMIDENGVLWFKDRLVVPKDKELKNQILGGRTLATAGPVGPARGQEGRTPTAPLPLVLTPSLPHLTLILSRSRAAPSPPCLRRARVPPSPRHCSIAHTHYVAVTHSTSSTH